MNNFHPYFYRKNQIYFFKFCIYFCYYLFLFYILFYFILVVREHEATINKLEKQGFINNVWTEKVILPPNEV